MKLSKPQQIISSDQNRFRIAACGRRFGKSMLSINEIAKFARYPDSKVLYVAPTYRQAKQVIWDELKDQLRDRNWIKNVNESDLRIDIVNGSRIYIRSSDNKDALRGSKYNFIVMDECADIDPDTWFSVLRPTLSDTGGSALFIGSPKGRNWFYDLWLQGQTQQDWSSHSYTTLEGGFVPQEEIESARRDLDERTFQQEYEAQFVSYSGVIFYAFSEANIKRIENPFADLRTPLHIGVDFNVDPMSAVICIKHYDTIHVIDEIEIYGSNTLELIKEIRNRYGEQRQMFVYPDASGSRRTTTSPGLSDHIHFKNNGFILKVNPTNPPVAEAIATVNSLLKNSVGEHRLTIDPGCKKLIECLNKFTYKEGTRVPDKGVYDHMTDALRYVCHFLMPLRPEINSVAPSRMNAGRML